MLASMPGGYLQEGVLPRMLDFRLIDGGDVGLLLVSIGRKHPHRFAFRLRGSLPRVLKARLNRYVVWKLRTGRAYLP
jgi:hypothetical protein